jgi:hypothetical protein
VKEVFLVGVAGAVMVTVGAALSIVTEALALATFVLVATS